MRMWRRGQSLASHLRDPSSIPELDVSRGLSLLFLLALFRRFFPGFRLSTKSTLQFYLDGGCGFVSVQTVRRLASIRNVYHYRYFTSSLPLSKLYCRERISLQCFRHSAASFLGLSSLLTARASRWFLNSSSDIVLMYS